MMRWGCGSCVGKENAGRAKRGRHFLKNSLNFPKSHLRNLLNQKLLLEPYSQLRLFCILTRRHFEPLSMFFWHFSVMC